MDDARLVSVMKPFENLCDQDQRFVQLERTVLGQVILTTSTSSARLSVTKSSRSTTPLPVRGTGTTEPCHQRLMRTV